MVADDTQRFAEAVEVAQDLAQEAGLDCFPQRFTFCAPDEMIENIAYEMPGNYGFYGFGREFDRIATRYREGAAGIPLEAVWNSNPSRAFVLRADPFPVKMLVATHVLAHNDFFKNNAFFANTNRSMFPQAAAARRRFREYEERCGIDRVETIIEAARSLRHHVDTDVNRQYIDEEELRQRALTAWNEDEQRRQRQARHGKDFSSPSISREELETKTPVFPERDLLWYLLHQPGLKDWEQDIVATVWAQARYFAPVRLTKIMNEGWATFWHLQLMQQLRDRGVITRREYNVAHRMHEKVVAVDPRMLTLNPYALGMALWKSADEQLGREAIFEIRRSQCDEVFVPAQLTKDVMRRIKLYEYEVLREPMTGKKVIRVKSRSLNRVRALLEQMLSNAGVPLIVVQDGDYRNGGLLLQHIWDGHILDPEYRNETLRRAALLWCGGGSAVLRTRDEDEEPVEFRLTRKGKIEMRDAAGRP